MCGIAGFVVLGEGFLESGKKTLEVMGKLIAHRGPDGSGCWIHEKLNVGLQHQRLAIIDLTENAAQPMSDGKDLRIIFNGEIYNYKELRNEGLLEKYRFQSESDTETILFSYRKYGSQASTKLRGMFAFALWDDSKQQLLISRDRFGIKPLYYVVVNGVFYFASEVKALLPLIPSIDIDPVALAEYLTFQYSLGEETLFAGIKQLMPGHQITINKNQMTVERYWDVKYEINFEKSQEDFETELHYLLSDSIDVHLRSDVEVGAYISGGIDSTLMGALASKHSSFGRHGFHGRFLEHPGYDESNFAEVASASMDGQLHICDITATDFSREIRNVIRHLDFPVAGPGSFPQYMVSDMASKHLKVVLGGQGGDEIFGGYARYLVAYFEQCIKAAIDGTSHNGNFVVTMESIVPNLGILREYTPLLQEFWRDGLFGPLDQRFLRLIDRSTDMKEEIQWTELDMQDVYQRFSEIFNSRENVAQEAYFDSMTHFEFKTLLPALLQVEDRMSMAHGLESRVPLLDHPLIEFAATVPADVKFAGGNMKHLLKTTFHQEIPSGILNRRDKMGFPVPLKEWFSNELSDFIQDVFSNMKSKDRSYVNPDAILKNFKNTGQFSRKTWALLSLEIWQQEFHDKASEFKALMK